jgi:hypothetical protein
MNSRRGVVQIAVVLAIAAVVGIVALIPSWHLPAFLQKKPPVAALSQAEVDLAKSKADLAAAQAKLDAAQAAKEKATHDQAQYAQQMVAGVPVALARAPQSPEVVLAAQLANRAQIGLAAAIGDLPQDKQAEITLIVGQALSAKQAEVDAAKAALAVRDSELAGETASKRALEAQIPPLQATVAAKSAEVQVKDAAVQEKTAEVSKWADLKSQADQKAGSLDAYAGNLMRILLIIGILYAVCHFVLPCLAAEFPASRVLSWFYRTSTSIVSAHTISSVTPNNTNT